MDLIDIPSEVKSRLRGRKILLYTGVTDIAGGPQLNALELAKLLHGFGAVVTVATLSGIFSPRMGEEIRKYARTVDTPFRSHHWRLLRNIYALFSWLLTLHPHSQDVVVCMGYGGFHRIMTLFTRRGGLLLERDTGDAATASGTPHPSFFHFIRKVDGVLVLSEEIRKRVLRQWPVNCPVIVVPELVPPPCPTLPRRNTQKVNINIAYLGRLAPGKNVDILIRIWPRLSVEDAQLHIYGGGPQEGDLRNIAQTIDPRRIHFHGAYDRDQLGAILKDIDLIVLPSTAEGLPTILIEGILAGIPFVATNVGSVAELALCHPDLIVVPFDEDAIVSAIERMVIRIREGRVDNEGIAKRAQKLFDYRKVASRWLQILAMNPEEIRAGSPFLSDAEA
jgi:glycosyltransferase involved in cell wall biosynthesis